jgi:hypothetical protein
VVEVIEVCGATPGLQREQIGVAAAVEWNRGHLPAGDHLAQLGAGGLDMQRVVDHAYGLRDAADLKRSIEGERRVGIEHESPYADSRKTRSLHLQFIMANRQNRETYRPFVVAVRLVRKPGARLADVHFGVGHSHVPRVLDRAGDAAAHAGPGQGSGQDSNDAKGSRNLTHDAPDFR